MPLCKAITKFEPSADIYQSPIEPPEIALRKAILDRAILDFANPTGTIEPKYCRSARGWLFGSDKRTEDTWPLHFLTICEDLDIDPERVRAYASKLRGYYKNNPRLTVKSEKELSKLPSLSVLLVNQTETLGFPPLVQEP